MKHDEHRFYREGRKVFDREKSSHGHDPKTGASVYCEARSGHAAEVIQRALNSWLGMGPARTPKMTANDYQQLRRLKRMAKKGSSNED